MSFAHKGRVALVCVLAWPLLATSTAFANPAGSAGTGLAPVAERVSLDTFRAQPTLISDLQLEAEPLSVELDDWGLERELLPLADLRLLTEFHPEIDRWTERNNRIRMTFYVAAMFFSRELRIQDDIGLGGRLNWEVPGFISIRIDSNVVPWSRMEVKVPSPINPNSSRHMSGMVHSHFLNIGLWNPELSDDDLVMWAGFGAGVWIYDYSEADIIPQVDGEFSDYNLAGNAFLELDYKVIDIFHVSFGVRLHGIWADHTDDGRFYKINGADAARDGRNEDDIREEFAIVSEFSINFSVLW